MSSEGMRCAGLLKIQLHLQGKNSPEIPARGREALPCFLQRISHVQVSAGRLSVCLRFDVEIRQMWKSNNSGFERKEQDVSPTTEKTVGGFPSWFMQIFYLHKKFKRHLEMLKENLLCSTEMEADE